MLIVTFYVLFLMVDLQIRISNARTELSQIEERIFTQEQTNAELKKVSDAVEKNDDKAFSDYVEKIAREDLDYVKNGEVVPLDNFCHNCGGREFTVERLEKIDCININYAVLIKAIAKNEAEEYSQSWIDSNQTLNYKPKLLR